MLKDFTTNRFFLYQNRFWCKKNGFFDKSLRDPLFQSGIRAPAVFAANPAAVRVT